jgi:hypothetical protein
MRLVIHVHAFLVQVIVVKNQFNMNKVFFFPLEANMNNHVSRRNKLTRQSFFS